MSDRPFFGGVNLPWVLYGCDFGTNAWRPQGGVAAGTDRARIIATLDALAASGASVVRWFIFCDGRAGLEFRSDAPAVTIDDRVFADLDVALELVADAGLRMLPVLFDFGWCHRARWVNGVQMGGRRRWFTENRHRHALVEGVVVPVAKRYGQHPAIYAWDVVNEPEWVTFGWGTWEPFASLSEQGIRRLLADVVDALHAHSQHPVTVGLASARWLRLVRGLDLDLYQVHWYDRLERRAPLATAVSALDLDRPAILGEFPTRGSAREPEEILAIAAQSGYAGALAWSALASDPATDGPAAALALTRFLKRETTGT